MATAVPTARDSIAASAIHAAGAIHATGAIASAASAPQSSTESWQFEAQLQPDPGPPASLLGSAVAINGKRAAVGSRRDEDLGTDSGVVHCYDFVRNAWRQSQLLKDPSGCVTCGFGLSLFMDTDRMVVGAPRDGALGFEAGRAHIFVRRGNRWAFEATVARPTPASAELFGHSVAIRGRVMVAGAPRAQLASSADGAWLHDAGAAEVFELRDGRWVHAATLLAPTPTPSAWFGHAVAVDRDLIAVGAFGESITGQSAGAVHLFRRTHAGWGFEQTLPSPWPGAAWFGFALAVEGDRVLVGAPRARSPGSSVSTGAAFLHERGSNGFQLAASLTAPWLAAGDGLGSSVAMDRDWLFVGTPGDDEAGEDAGAVYLFQRVAGRFRPPEKLSTPGVNASDRAGISLAATHGRAIAGRGGDIEASPIPGEGTAWIYALSQTPRARGAARSTAVRGPSVSAPSTTSPFRPPYQ